VLNEFITGYTRLAFAMVRQIKCPAVAQALPSRELIANGDGVLMQLLQLIGGPCWAAYGSC